MTDKPTPPAEEDQHPPAEVLAAAMRPRLRRPEPPIPAVALAAVLVARDPSATVH